MTLTPTEQPRPDLLTLSEAAERLRMSERWLRREVAARRVPFVQLGSRLRFTPEHIERIIVDRSQAGRAGAGFGQTARSRAAS